MIIAPHFPAWVDAAEPAPGARQAIEWRASESLHAVRARVRPELQLHTVFTTRPSFVPPAGTSEGTALPGSKDVKHG